MLSDENVDTKEYRVITVSIIDLETELLQHYKRGEQNEKGIPDSHTTCCWMIHHFYVNHANHV